MDWTYDRLPEENRVILLFNNFEGLCLGYFARGTFYSLREGIELRDVCAWCYVPDKPDKYERVLDRVLNKNMMRLN